MTDTIPLCQSATLHVSVYYTEICHYMSTNYIVKGIGILPFNFPRTLLAVFLISAISSSNSSFISAETVNRISLFLLFYYFSFFFHFVNMLLVNHWKFAATGFLLMKYIFANKHITTDRIWDRKLHDISRLHLFLSHICALDTIWLFTKSTNI